jgi:hypothetical protein
MSDSQKETLCIVTFSVPSALGVIGTILYFFWPKFKQYVSDLSEWIQTGWRQQLTSFIAVVLAFFTMVEIYTAWYKLSNPSVELSDKMPDDRCVPFFYVVKEFIDANPRTTALYAYDKGRSLVRLCTDAPEAVVVAKFQNESILSQLPMHPNTAGCSWAQVAAVCSVTDRSSPSKTAPTCAQLLQTPPLPNGFFYRSTVKYPEETSCALQFFVNQDLPSCNYSSVYRLEKNPSDTHILVLAVGLAIPSAFLIGNIITFYQTNQKKKAGQPLTKDDINAFAFAMEGPIGCIIGTFKLEKCYPFSPEEMPRQLTWQYFAFLQVQTLVEAVVLPVMAVYGCRICQYFDIVALIVAKAIQFSWTIKKFMDEPEPAPSKPESAPL